MRINIITSLIAVGLSALLGYAVYSVTGNDENATLAFVVSSICFLVGLLFAFGVSYNDSKKGVSLRVFSFLVVLVSVIAQFAFAVFGITQSYYIITSGIILLLYLLIFNGIYKSQQM